MLIHKSVKDYAKINGWVIESYIDDMAENQKSITFTRSGSDMYSVLYRDEGNGLCFGTSYEFDEEALPSWIDTNDKLKSLIDQISQ